MSSQTPELAQPLVATDSPTWGLRRHALYADRAIGVFCEAFGAALVLAETCILFAGVVSRYVFSRPLMWTDELANFLFLWLAMLGMVVALRRNEHMRLMTLINSLSFERSQWLSTVGALVVIVFVLEILVPAVQYLEVQRSTELRAFSSQAIASSVRDCSKCTTPIQIYHPDMPGSRGLSRMACSICAIASWS